MKFSRSLLLAALAATSLSNLPLNAADQPAEGSNKDWFHKARFGMFIHWGIYAVPAGVWQGKNIGWIGEWIMKNGKIPIADYKNFGKEFTAANYDPKAWAALAKEAGMQYVVITSKHHDGFALFDTKASDWNAIEASAAKRDLIEPLEKAVRAEGLKFGLYYSQAQDWTHPGGAAMGVKEGEAGWDPAQAGSFDDYLKKIAFPQVEEILSKFQPDIVWWDTPVNMNDERAKPFAELLAKYPQIITNDRLGGRYKGDTKTPEQHIPPRGYPGQMFEVCMTMNDTWGYKSTDHNWKSVQAILENLSDISSKGGNFLLNIGPKPDGTIPQESIDRLKAVGAWMKVNGEAIYDTIASPFSRRLPWGRVTQRVNKDGTVTFYAHVWSWPADGRIVFPTVQELPASGKMLADGEKVNFEKSPAGLVAILPGKARDPHISVVQIDFPSAPVVTQKPYVEPGDAGALAVQVLDIDPHGNVGGNIQVEGSGDAAKLTGWTSGDWYVDFRIKMPKAGKWTLKAEVSNPKPVSVTVKADKANLTAEIPAGEGWRSVTLGEIELPAGEQTVEIRPVKDKWSPVELRRVELVPVAP